MISEFIHFVIDYIHLLLSDLMIEGKISAPKTVLLFNVKKLVYR